MLTFGGILVDYVGCLGLFAMGFCFGFLCLFVCLIVFVCGRLLVFALGIVVCFAGDLWVVMMV